MDGNGGASKTRRCLSLQQPAPDFEVMTTAGQLRLSDYQGRWVVLFAHPADFTPVCTSEIVQLSRVYQQFKNLNAEIVGLSVDSHYTHVAWFESIEESFGIKVPFPMIDDQSREVATLYGMVHPDSGTTATMRSTFVIDDAGILRLMMHYPMWVGRSVNEILRVLHALQASDRDRVALPEGWRPGKEVVELPDRTKAAAQRRLSLGETARTWFSLKDKPASKSRH